MTPWTAALQASLLPEVYSNSCPLSWWCHPAISFSVTSFSSYSQSFPIRVLSNESALIGASASASVLPMNIQGWFPLGLTGLISFVQGTLKSIFHYHSLRASVLWCSAFFIVQLSHPYMTTGKTIALTRQTFVGKVMSLLDLTNPACIPSSALPWPIDMTFNLHPPWVSKIWWRINGPF